MKKVILMSVFICFIISGKTQVVNLNPDPNGEPWLSGGVPLMSPEDQSIIDAIPIMTRQFLNNFFWFKAGKMFLS